MCVPLIVFLAAPNNMLNHFRATAPAAADQIACAKSLKQGFGLIQPGSIGWSKQHMDARFEVFKELRGLIACMAGTVIHNQVNTLSPTVGMKEALHSWTKVVAVILVQALCKHMPRMQGQARQQMDRPMPLIVILHSFDLSGSHGLFRIQPFQHLQVGLLVSCQEDFAALPQALDSFVIPENFEGPRDSFIIPDSRFPKTKQRQSQISSIQDFAHGCVIDGLGIFLLDGRFSQTSKRPMRRMPTDTFWFAARQPFNLPALTSGKKQAADPVEEHRIRRLGDRHRDSVGKSAKWSRRSVRTLHSKSQPAAFYPRVVTRSELGVQSAKVFSHLAATCASRLYPSASTEISPAFDHAWFISNFRQMTNPTMCG